MPDIPVITVDGHSGSGKGTLARRLADKLGYGFLDSGALYRLVALAALQRGVALDDATALASISANLDVRFGSEPGDIVLDGHNVARELRTEQCGDAASRVAVIPAVREALLGRQRAFRLAPGLVADGRDMGTVVFPDAGLKIFLTATLEQRAKRRHKQLIEQGISAKVRDLLNELAARDTRDQNRSVAPLKPAEDAVVLDSSGLSVEEVLAKVLPMVSAL